MVTSFNMEKSAMDKHVPMRLLIFITLLNTCFSEGSKRILLNDPDLLNTQLQQVLHQVQDLSSKYVDLESKYVALQTNSSVMSSKYVDLESKYVALQTNSSTLSSKYVDLESKYVALHTSIKSIDSNNSGGVVFVRWGRKQCPDNDTELVYSGFAGGSYYNHEGAATTLICLSPDPIWGKNSTITGNYVYGAEFDIDFFGPGTSTGDIPCAVCRSKSASSLLMIPGRNQCYAEWKTQYGGYLMAGYYSHAASTDFSCVDEHPEFILGGNDNDEGRLLYAVKAQCGSLECPPYVNNKVVTCAVCTK